MSDAWSEWLDLNMSNIETVPQSPGVCMMHASMKILYIGASNNIRQELSSRLSNPCTAKAQRFRYLVTNEFAIIKEQRVKEYISKHGRLPPCMERNDHDEK